MKNVWVLESWSKATYPMPDGMTHDTCIVGIFSDENKALEYASKNDNYAGTADTWFWAVQKMVIDKDVEHSDMPKFYKRNMCPCDSHGDIKLKSEHIDLDVDDDEENDDYWGDVDDEEVEFEKDDDPVIVKNPTLSVSQDVKTKQDVDEFIERLEKFREELPERKEKTDKEFMLEALQQVTQVLTDLAKLVEITK